MRTDAEMVDLNTRIQDAFKEARREHFEDGYNSRFGSTLQQIIEFDGLDALSEIHRIIGCPITQAETSRQALLAIASVRSPGTANTRRKIAEACLTHRNSTVRDGAVLALSQLRDRKSIDALKHALGQENVREMATDLRQAIEELEGA